jgi:anthranilate phosphoribosyltransferase
MTKEAIALLIEGKSLTMEQASSVMTEIMCGEVTPAQFGALVTALRIKGETYEEIAGFATAMRARAVRVNAPANSMDIVGTGGDNKGTFNVSTAAAFVVAGAGITVAKHNNRAMSSRCGSADVLEALGVKIDLGAPQVETCLQEVGIGFMFAPNFHPATRFASAPRREIGIRTVFNILGPLTNPAFTKYQLIGVPGKVLGEKLALVLARMGSKHALVVSGQNGIDEVSISSKTTVWEVDDKKSNLLPARFEVSPEDFGLKRAPLKSILGGTPAENARILRDVLEGKKGPYRDVVVINAAMALIASSDNSCSNPDTRQRLLKDNLKRAQKSIDSGAALAKLNKLVEVSNRI